MVQAAEKQVQQHDLCAAMQAEVPSIEFLPSGGFRVNAQVDTAAAAPRVAEALQNYRKQLELQAESKNQAWCRLRTRLRVQHGSIRSRQVKEGGLQHSL